MASKLDEDYAMALMLEEQFAMEDAHQDMTSFVPPEFLKGSPTKEPQPSTSKAAAKMNEANDKSGLSIIAPEWEDLDPTPDLQALFVQYDKRFFWNKLVACEVRWSPRMTLCAGICSYSPRQGYCSIRLSVPLLKLRPRKDLVETLLHEMIHAYLFVTDGNDDHDGHGPAFHQHMYRINQETGTNISVYHTFHDEVALYKQHWWKCNGPCVGRRPFYGLVKRSMNRAPGPNDTWWKQHQATCGGTFIKIKEPEGYGQKKSTAAAKKKDLPKGQKDIRSFGKSSTSPPKKKPASASQGSTVSPKKKTSSFSGQPGRSSAKPSSSSSGSISGGGGRGNIFGFGGTSFGSPSSGMGLKTQGKTGSFVVNPGWKAKDNSSVGHVVNGNQSSSTSGKSPGNQSSSEDVRAKMRDVWANKFSGKQKPTASSKPELPASSVKKKLNAPSSSKMSNDDEGQLQSCPICDKKIPETKMNPHLDECLTINSLRSPEPKKAKKNPFLDD